MLFAVCEKYFVRLDLARHSFTGTGTNACYMENLDKVGTWDGPMDEPKQVQLILIIINIPCILYIVICILRSLTLR